MKTRTKVICILAALVVVAVITVPPFILSLAISTGMSELEVLMRAMEDQTVDDGIISVSDEDVEDYVYYKIGEDCFDEIHQKILMTDWNSIPDDANYIVNDGNGYYWSNCPLKCKGWAMLYALAAEICMREEVNPEGTEIIRPLDLIGEMCCETMGENQYFAGGLLNSLKYSSKWGYLYSMVNTYDMDNCWLSKDDVARGDSDPFKEYGDGDTQPTWDDLAGYGFGSLYGNTLWPSMVIDPGDGYYYGCMIYISSFESQDLDNSKRAIHGTRKGLHNNEGRYVDVNFWEGPEGYAKMETAPTEEIAENISFGKFNGNNIAGYKSRPAMYFLSDAMYSQAIFLRAHIKGYNIENLTYYSEGSKAYIPNQITGDDEYAREARKMLGIWLNVGVGVVNDPNWDKLVAGYSKFSSENVNPLIERSSTGVDTNTLMGYPNAFGRVYLQHETIGYSIASDKCTLFDDLDLALTYADGNPWTYGFGCVNYGNFMKLTVETQIKAAYAKQPKWVPKEPAADALAEVLPHFVAPLNNLQVAEDGYPGLRIGQRTHYGIDFIAEPGARVRASISGKWRVVDVDGFKCVILETGEYSSGKLCIVYGNIVPESGKSGTVRQGDTIGIVQQYRSEVVSDSTGTYNLPNVPGRSYVHFGIFTVPQGKEFYWGDQQDKDGGGLWNEHHPLAPYYTSGDTNYAQFIPPTMWRFYKDADSVVELKPHLETVYYTEYEGAPEERASVELNLAGYVGQIFEYNSAEYTTAEQAYQFGYNHVNEGRLVWGTGGMLANQSTIYAIPNFENYYDYGGWNTHNSVQAILNQIAEEDREVQAAYAASADGLLEKIQSCGFGDLLTDEEYEAFTKSWGFDCKMNSDSLTYFTIYLTGTTKEPNSEFNIYTDAQYIRVHTLKANLGGNLHKEHNDNGLDTHCGYYNGYQCYGFARYIEARLSGVESKQNKILLGPKGEGVYCGSGGQVRSCLKDMFKPGMHVRVDDPHSYIVLGASEDEIVIWDCNVRDVGGARYRCGVKLHRYKWENLPNHYYGTVTWVSKPTY